MIAIRDLTKNYGSMCAVSALSFEVAPGEIVGLIGPNGAGKTSTLRCIAGIHRPTTGVVSVGGHDIVRDAVAAKRLTAFVADEPHLFEHLTVREHLLLVGRLYSGQLMSAAGSARCSTTWSWRRRQTRRRLSCRGG